MAKQSKRAQFAHRQRRRRLVARITKDNAMKPGFVGVITKFEVNGEAFGSLGAAFIRKT